MIKQALDAFARTTARAFADRESSIGASEIGQCSRKVFFAKNSGDPFYNVTSDEDYNNPWGAALRGSLFEDHFWVPALRARFGDKLLYAGAEQKTLISGCLSATPDGLLIDQPRDAFASVGVADIGESGCLVVECKTIDPRARLDEPRPEHSFQAIVQMGMFAELTPYRPNWAVISYANASFLDDVVEFPVRFDPAIFAAAKARAAQIMMAQSPEDLRPEGWIAGGRECEYCPFNRACGRIRHAVPTAPISEPPDPQFVVELSNMAREAKERRRAVEAATIALRTVEHEIRERLRAKALRRVIGNGVSVVWSPVRGRPAYDMPAIRDAAEKAGVDLTEFVSVGDPTDRLVITMIRDAAPAAA
jgi:hypothetical protein